MVSTSSGLAASAVSFPSNSTRFPLSLSPSLVFLLHSSLHATYPSTSSHLTPPDPPTPQIKRFLEDTDDAELNKFVKDFPGSESCHQPEAKTWVSRPQVLEPKPQAPDLYQDDLEFRPPSCPQPSESQQYFSASAPLSPSARPRSPWGKLDPYDSSEDDKEYVGFATLPNQVHRKSVKKGFDFTLMVAGESGLGKSTLVNSLFLTDLYRDRKLLSAEERIMQTVEITKHAVDIEEKGVRLRLTIVDTPGFGDAVNNTECWKPVAEYIDQQFEQYFRDESGLNRKNIQDNRVHCCLYFISPFGHGYGLSLRLPTLPGAAKGTGWEHQQGCH
uniref:Septin-type G domain-containing protein n=1 Tax=Suricata suricatta TaxID=37032 RepID=A0A673V3Z4_SURSU